MNIIYYNIIPQNCQSIDSFSFSLLSQLNFGKIDRGIIIRHGIHGGGPPKLQGFI